MAIMPMELEALDATIYKTNKWLNDIDRELGGKGINHALKALHAVLCALRDRLSVKEGSQMTSRFPILIRGLFYENWQPGRIHTRGRNDKKFITKIGHYFPRRDPFELQCIVRAVFKVMDKNIPEKESDDVKSSIPMDIRKYWPASKIRGIIYHQETHEST